MRRFCAARSGLRYHHDEANHADLTAELPAHEHTPCGHAHEHTHTKAVLDRLSRAIGHLSGVRTMVEEGRDCSEVLIQLVAVRSALNATCRIILQDHMDHCVVDAIESGDTKTLEELNKAISLLLK